MYEHNIKGGESAAEFRNIQDLNRDNKFQVATKKSIENMYEFIINRENKMHVFGTAVDIAKKKFPGMSSNELLKLINKAAILEAANHFDDEQLGLIKAWFNSNYFNALLRSFKESQYVSSDPYHQENIFSTFKDVIDEISETKPFDEGLDEDAFEELDKDDPLNYNVQ